MLSTIHNWLLQPNIHLGGGTHLLGGVSPSKSGRYHIRGMLDPSCQNLPTAYANVYMQIITFVRHQRTTKLPWSAYLNLRQSNCSARSESAEVKPRILVIVKEPFETFIALEVFIYTFISHFLQSEVFARWQKRKSEKIELLRNLLLSHNKT